MKILFLDVELIKRLLDYNPETGAFTWKERPPSDFPLLRLYERWRKSFAGRPAGTVNGSGHLVIRINNQRVRAHRLAWLIMTGEQPPPEIGHRDRNPANNRWRNLREATRSQNNANSKTKSTNTSGFRGVSRHQDGRWYAYANFEGKRHYLGLHDTAEQAAEVAAAKRLELHQEFAR